MKKFTTIFLFAIFTFAFCQNVISGDRMMLVERFTSWTCPPCASNNPIMDAWLNSKDIDQVVGISYHMNWPSPGNDGFYLYNVADNTTRRTYYNVNAIPQAQIDGLITYQPPYSSGGMDSYFSQRNAILSPITIILKDSTYSNNTVTMNVLIYCEAPLSDPNINVQFAVIERYKHYSSPPGTNGEMDFYDIMRKMLPTANGQNFVIFPGQTINLQYSYQWDPVWQTGQIRNMVFVQTNSNKEVLGAALKTSNFTMLPNPAFKVVSLGQSQNAAFKIKIPYVASGFNSPVTMTATVVPATSGVTVTFPSGNVISNFPDSVSMQVSSTSSVPAGAYQIVVTGTSGTGKIHKTTVHYLVGQNYVTIGANRSDATFKIDGTTYSTLQFNTWNIGATHTIEAITPQLHGSTQYVFLNWSDSGTASHTITVGTATSSYTANFKTQFRLGSSVTPSGIPVTVNGGNTFYDSSTTATLSLSALQLQWNGLTYYFQNWQGFGGGSYSGTNPSPQITLNNAVIETANYDTIPPIGIVPIGSSVPKVYALHQNYPNPFNPTTSIKFDMPKDGHLSLKVYDLLGKEVAVLFDGVKQAGYYEATFNGSNLASGVYLYKMESGDFTSVKRLVILK